MEPYSFKPTTKYMGVSKNRGKTPKMDGENNGKPYEQIDDLEVALFLETPMFEAFVKPLADIP